MSSHQIEGDARLVTEFPADAHHICLIFSDEIQLENVVSEFLGIGLRKGELSRYAADVATPKEVLDWVRKAGVDVPDGGSLTVFQAAQFYAPSGEFDPREVLGLMVPRWEQAERAGYKGVRICGEMSWTLRGVPGSERFLEYEAGINGIASPFPHCGMCLYDARLFDGATLFKVMQVHPFIIAHGQVVSNPYYVRPEEFFGEQ
jgi:hypothetical protein